MLPEAPARFSTTTFCENCSDRRAASVRATASTAPPAANGTISLTGREGYPSAAAADAVASRRNDANQEARRDDMATTSHDRWLCSYYAH